MRQTLMVRYYKEKKLIFFQEKVSIPLMYEKSYKKYMFHILEVDTWFSL